MTSAPVKIFVDTPPVSSGPVFNLTSDVVGGVEVTVLAEDTGRRRQVV